MRRIVLCLIVLLCLCGCVKREAAEFAIDQGYKAAEKLRAAGAQVALFIRIDPTGTFFPWGYVGKTEVIVIALGYAQKGAKADVGDDSKLPAGKY